MTHSSISATCWCKSLLFPEWPTSASDPPRCGLLSGCISQLFWLYMLLHFSANHKMSKKPYELTSYQKTQHIRTPLAAINSINFILMCTIIYLVWLVSIWLILKYPPTPLKIMAPNLAKQTWLNASFVEEVICWSSTPSKKQEMFP